MNPLDAFLFVSGLSYVFCVLSPKPLMMIDNWGLEKIGLGAMGCLLLFNLYGLNHSAVWMGLGIVYSAACLSSYFGLVKWRVYWRSDVSEIMQISMAFWDLLIGVVCLIKA